MDDDDFSRLLRFSNRKPKEQAVPSLRAPRGHLPLGSRNPPQLSALHSPQRVTVKVSYGPPTALKRHLAYLERDGKGLDGSKPELFTQSNKEIPAAEISGEPRFFRFILSPENGSNLADMQKYTRDFMQKVNDQRSGGDLQWFASVHYNTANPHAHIVIRGIDTTGQEVLFDRNFVSQEARQIASELATRELGPRTRYEINAQVSRDLVSDRFTSIDRGIERNMDITRRVHPPNQHQRERLEFLERNLNLAHKARDGSYQLDPHWKERLQYNGRKQDIVKTIYNDMPPELQKPWLARRNDQHLTICQKSWKVEGKITAAGIADELTDRPYVVIESKGGKPYYFTDRSLNLSQHQVGDEVRLHKGQITSLTKHKESGLQQGDAAAQGNMPRLHKGPSKTVGHDQGIEY